MGKQIASISIDLDNKWAYMKTHGDSGWDSFPSYLDLVVPRMLDFFSERKQHATFFVVGKDATLEKNHDALKMLTAQGHEVANHSFLHEPWMHLYDKEKIYRELSETEEHIQRVTGQKPVGFRGPGFSFSRDVFDTLVQLGYKYDATTFPTFIGPLAKKYFLSSANLSPEEEAKLSKLYGKFSAGFQSLSPYRWQLEKGALLEIPVTTMPIFKMPIHLSYLLFLQQKSPGLARIYFKIAMLLCRMTRVAPSLLLHPLDFLGCDDDKEMSYFPGMTMLSKDKIELVSDVLAMMTKSYDVQPMYVHAASVTAIQKNLPQIQLV